MRVSLLAAFIAASLTSAQQPQTGAIAGTITDTSGGVLPGVTITFTGPTTGKVVSKAGGDYRIDNLTPGQYRLDIAAVGFRGTKQDVSVEVGLTATISTSLRLGVFTLVDYAMPAGVAEAIRESDVVAYVRLTVAAGVRIVNDAMIVTDHDATIESVVKADAPSIVAGRSLRFAQDSAGQWVEPGYKATGWEAPYQPGDAFVAFLKRNRDKTLGEYRGNAYMWRVKQGFVIPVNPVGPLLPGLRSPMPVDAAIDVLRKPLRTAQQVQTGAVTGTVTDASGGTLPGVTVKWYGQKTGEVVTNGRGEYRIEGLDSGPYRVEFTLPGFRRGTVDLVVEPGRAAEGHMRLRLGIMTTHGLIVELPFSKILSDVPVIAYLSITKPVGPHLIYGTNLATEHEATVIDLLKTDDPAITTGSSFRFSQLYAGFWMEDGRTYMGESKPYVANQSFVAFLFRNRDGKLTEHAGPRHMYPVSTDGRVTIVSVSAAPMPVDEALAALRKLLTAKDP